MDKLQPGQAFPTLSAPALGGDTMDLPQDVRGSRAILLFYRGHW